MRRPEQCICATLFDAVKAFTDLAMTAVVCGMASVVRGLARVFCDLTSTLEMSRNR